MIEPGGVDTATTNAYRHLNIIYDQVHLRDQPLSPV